MFLRMRERPTRKLADIAQKGDDTHVVVPVIVVYELEMIISPAFQHALNVLLDLLCVVEDVFSTQDIALFDLEAGVSNKGGGATNLFIMSVLDAHQSNRLHSRIMKALQRSARHQMADVQSLCRRINTNIHRLRGSDALESVLDKLGGLIDEPSVLEIRECLHEESAPSFQKELCGTKDSEDRNWFEHSIVSTLSDEMMQLLKTVLNAIASTAYLLCVMHSGQSDSANFRPLGTNNEILLENVVILFLCNLPSAKATPARSTFC